MSRSFKRKAIVKDKGIGRKFYWRNVRSTIKNSLRTQLYKDLDTLELPNPKTIINDYTYCDYWFNIDNFYKKYIKKYNKYRDKIFKYLNKDYVINVNKCKRK